MGKYLLGVKISYFGFGITTAGSFVYPLGFIQDILVFFFMLLVGTSLMVIGKLISEKAEKSNSNNEKFLN
ncbi:hypothetical protein [Halalkalibacter akibai]|uniref:Uncharacterized protein n=1 Tax=Halalkalibacter akibai (strain ATCC 43226 / DSM 21942 / CIP 109018 / JCM 9157 / 1139) TaxID=1236973 RepID=W4R013_HALA3|nr:hypothetical protein [Halalkalibacter akibai]GAE37676.1 hypothetical protein JCM9157_4994 [Halalkalibacter akibai JCM 9157]